MKATGWTSTEAVYGISRDDHCCGVVYRCDCGCDSTEGQGWLKRKIINFGPFCLSLFQCSRCLKWFGQLTLLFSTSWLKKEYKDPVPAFYKQFIRPSPGEVAKKWNEAPYVLSPSWHNTPVSRLVTQYIPCFWCGRFTGGVYASPLFIYCNRSIAISDTMICLNCRALIDYGVQWVYCYACERLWWEYPNVIKEHWIEYLEKKPNRFIDQANIVMVDRCRRCE